MALLMVLPLTTWASPVWHGDFESGDLSQWTGRESVAANRLQIVEDPVREGRFALKATVYQGDDPIGASGNRNELLHYGNESEGTEYFYKWSTMFAPDFPSVNTWQLFTQWHHDGNSGSPPLEFFVRGENMHLRVEGRDDRIVWKAPLERGKWLDFVLHVKWSSDRNVGFVELYYNGQLVLPRTPAATLYWGMQNYLKQGLYRDAAVGPAGVVYHDGMIQATSLEDVMPPPAPVQDAPVAAPVEAPPPVASAPAPGQPPSGGGQLASNTPAPTTPAQKDGCSSTGESMAGLGLPALCAAAGRVMFSQKAVRRGV